MTQQIVDQVREAGVIGAGGAGFPTYVKLQARVDTYIANAAECEPLLEKDQGLMRAYPEEMIHGLRVGMQATGAARGVIAIKKKYTEAIAALQQAAAGASDIHFYYYDNFYPAGDEYIIVYDVMGRLIPPGGIPLDVGCVVNNVETLINVSRATRGVPVTHTALTVAGCVHEAVSALVPIGVTAREVLSLAGGATVDDPVLLDGGAMMGKVVTDLDTAIVKNSGGYIVLPRSHKLIQRKTAPMEVKVQIAKSACDQCMYCTEFCPRFLLGYAIEPHKVMRSVGFAGEAEAGWAQLGLQCCECGICDLYACPEDLPPKDMCIRSKGIWKMLADKPAPLPGTGEAHPMRDSRRVPIPALVRRLGLEDWDVHAPMTDRVLDPSRVRIMLQQHIGAPAIPMVAVGDRVAAGQKLGAPPEGKLGVPVHSSIAGRVTRIDPVSIWVER
ncbi:MAG: NADH dehydrogenase subunit [Deltaproteobacteria bacterium HGW-Deltaproteobacteria-14]|jgi:Na+-translocating ferredoxin:NAD+ oxidoreductase RnfC subunit|nr:MAG: NADH dehydrogenase subunit [Deltaproteobacteria bacterium HGW-Deltaproteobacteria-14]